MSPLNPHISFSLVRAPFAGEAAVRGRQRHGRLAPAGAAASLGDAARHGRRLRAVLGA